MASYASRTSYAAWFAALVMLCFVPLAAQGGLIRLDSANGNTDTDPNDFSAVTPYTLAQDTAGQKIYIYASGAAPGQSLNVVGLNVEIGADDGSIIGPKITAVDLKGITDGSQTGIFDQIPTGQTHYTMNQGVANFTPGDSASKSQFWSAYITADSNVVFPSTPQLLAVVTIDTTGVAAGTSYDLKLDASQDPSEFTDHGSQLSPPVTIVDGIVTISGQVAPEPASLGLLSLGAIGLLLRRRGPVAGV